ncbi:citrate synthase, mitochondrial [Artemisia annua]|uniref:Citrate synthase, mitochondrial n=1 Tax=Artemisia annua TaxID=35608 RepID=A0A2U1KLI3_ARTAN|nr:citrate synthase, mitochondrial [Artemisia annua]
MVLPLDIRSHLKELIPEQQDRLEKIKSEYGKVQLGNITVDMVLGGVRGMTGLLWETSLLDPDEVYILPPIGNSLPGLSIPECQQVLPAAKPGGEPLPEDHVYKPIDALPITAHPMTQFTTSVRALQINF